MFVYIIYCSENNKYYVGQHIGRDLQAYLREKSRHALRHTQKKNHIYSALRKYLFESFSIQPLAEVQTKKELDDLEKLWIITLDARNDEVGMNIAVGGEGGWSGLHHSPETLTKMSEVCGHPISENQREEHRQRMLGSSNPIFGKKRSFSQKWLDNLSQGQKGRRHAKETIDKMRESAHKRWAKGCSDETRRNMSVAQKKRFAKVAVC